MGKWHPLHTAAIGGNFKAVQKEYSRLSKGKGKRGGNVLNDIQDSNGYSSLHFAVQSGNLEMIKWLVENGADVNIQSKKISSGVTPLIIATSKGKEDIVKVLLDCGANPRIGRTQDGFTPLHISAKNNNCRIARMILEHVPSAFSVLTSDGQSCLDIAKISNLNSDQFSDVIYSIFPDKKELLQRKTQRMKHHSNSAPNYDSRLCRTLIELSRSRKPERLQEFLSLNPTVNLNWTLGKNGWTPLMEVSAIGDEETAKVLLNAGADCEIRSKKGDTALHISARYGQKDILRLLLENGACLDVVTPAGETVEEVASKYGQSAVFSFLVAYRAELIVSSRYESSESRFRMTSIEANKAPSTADMMRPSISLQSWLEEIGLEKYLDVLQSNGFETISSLSMLTEEDFSSMNFLLAHKRLMLIEFEKIKVAFPGLLSMPKTPFSSSNSLTSEGGSKASVFRSASSTPEGEQQMNIYAAADVLRGDNTKTESSGSILNNEDSTLSSTENNSMTMIKEIRYHELDIRHVIGEGSFGIVHFGYWRGINVAVKALKTNDNVSAFSSLATSTSTAAGDVEEPQFNRNARDEEFLRHEAKLMARVCNHDHVVQFVGIIVKPHPCVVTIFCSGGSVEDMLVRSKTRHDVEVDTILRMAVEAAKGIRHLHLEGVIHRDLAARNLLLDSNLRIRVADFGFSRVKQAAASKGYTTSEMGPIRWLAPEAMRQKVYSEASDVFSFGVVLYEMFWKSEPWPGYDTLDVAIRVCSGERMEVSTSAEVPAEVMETMRACWLHAASSRPALLDVIATLEGLLYDHVDGSFDLEENHHAASNLAPPNEYSFKLGNEVMENDD